MVLGVILAYYIFNRVKRSGNLGMSDGVGVQDSGGRVCEGDTRMEIGHPNEVRDLRNRYQYR